MADYKSILKGTINSVTKKAKDYVESGSLKDAYDKGQHGRALLCQHCKAHPSDKRRA